MTAQPDPFYNSAAQRNAIVQALLAQAMGSSAGGDPGSAQFPVDPSDPADYSTDVSAANVHGPTEAAAAINAGLNANAGLDTSSGFNAGRGSADAVSGNPSSSTGITGPTGALAGPAGLTGLSNTGGAFAGNAIGFGINGGPGFGGSQQGGMNVDAASNVSPGYTGFSTANAAPTGDLAAALGLNDIAGPMAAPGPVTGPLASSNIDANAANVGTIANGLWGGHMTGFNMGNVTPGWGDVIGDPTSGNVMAGYNSPAATVTAAPGTPAAPSDFGAVDAAANAANAAVAAQMSDALAGYSVTGTPGPGYGSPGPTGNIAADVGYGVGLGLGDAVGGGFGGATGDGTSGGFGGEAGGPGVGGASTGISGGPGGTGEGGANTGEGGTDAGGAGAGAGGGDGAK